MEALGGGLGGLWNSNHPFRKRPKKLDSKSKSSDSAAATGKANYWFPLKQAVMAGSLALTSDTIAQLRERWTKREPLNSDSNALTEMIKEALLALNERSGSSPYAIAKYMEEKHKDVLPLNYKKILGLQLKNSVVRGKLIKIKASYKLSKMAKGEKVTTTTTKAMKKSDAAKKAVKKVTKKVGPKQTKKSTLAKPKQPKLIKSPVAKRAKRTVA